MKAKFIAPLILAISLVSMASLSVPVSACYDYYSLNMWVFFPRIEITETGPFVLDQPNTVYELTVDLKVPENDFHGFVIEADGIVLDLNFHTITGSPDTFGVFCDGRTDITIAYGTINGFLKAIVVIDSENVLIKYVEVPACGILYVRPNAWLQRAFVRRWLSEIT